MTENQRKAAENYDSLDYRRFTAKGELDKALHTLEGLIKGIAIDRQLNTAEFRELDLWMKNNHRFLQKNPFLEVGKRLDEILEDGIITEEEKEDFLWFCNSLSTRNHFYDILTSDIQRLQGIMHGILSDNRITEEEVLALEKWVQENSHLKGLYPYDELDSLLVSILADHRITSEEKNTLKLFFSQFVDLDKTLSVNPQEIAKLKKDLNINGICAVCPEIVFENRTFCLTGISARAKRSEIAALIEEKAGRYSGSVTNTTHYLIVGNFENPCWAFSCYGRKVEKAMALRKTGNPIQIIHESDFWDELY